MRGQTFEHKSALAKGTRKGPERLQIAGVNIAFSHNGLEKVSLRGLLFFIIKMHENIADPFISIAGEDRFEGQSVY